ncbi:MAG: peptidoglycan-binding domain-containing protein [Cocleimonas sp.]
MKITNQLSIATLVLAGVFATGCSQQSAGGSQVSGASQAAGSQQVSGGSQVSGASQAAGSQQVSGGSQVAGGGSQQAGSQQQVEAPAPVVAAPAVMSEAVRVPKAAPRRAPVRRAPARRAPARRVSGHYHPAIPRCTNSVRHNHKNAGKHHHKYSCRKAAPRRAMARVAAPARRAPAQVDIYALQRKLKAKGYYKGPIDGVVGSGTRSALKRFMQR